MTKQQELALNAKGEGCLGRSKDDEPIFILCGRDPVAGEIIREWADRREVRAHRTGTLDAQEKAKIREARIHSLAMDDWPKKGEPV